MQTAITDFETDAYHLLVCSFDDVDCSQVEDILTDDEKKRFQILSGKRRQEFAVARTILYSMLGNRYEYIRYTAEEKPYLESYNISISHSKNYCAVIISSNAQVGVDIEEYRTKITQLAPRFMTNAELQKFTTIEQQTLVWCAKEALFKLTNAGADFRKNFHVHSIDAHPERGSMCAEVKNENLQFVQNLCYIVHQNFCLVWSVK